MYGFLVYNFFHLFLISVGSFFFLLFFATLFPPPLFHDFLFAAVSGSQWQSVLRASSTVVFVCLFVCFMGFCLNFCLYFELSSCPVDIVFFSFSEHCFPPEPWARMHQERRCVGEWVGGWGCVRAGRLCNIPTPLE